MKKSKVTFFGILSGLAVAFHAMLVMFLMIFLPILYAFAIIFIIALIDVFSGSETEIIKALEYDKAMWVSYDENAWFVASDDNEEKYGVRCVGRINYYGQWYDFVPNIIEHNNSVAGFVFPDGIDNSLESDGLDWDEAIEIYDGYHSVDYYDNPEYTINIDRVLDLNYIPGNIETLDFERLDILDYSGCYESVYSDVKFDLNYDDTFNLYINDELKQGFIRYEGRYVILQVSNNEIYVFENYGSLVYNEMYSVNEEKITDGTVFSISLSDWGE